MLSTLWNIFSKTQPVECKMHHAAHMMYKLQPVSLAVKVWRKLQKANEKNVLIMLIIYF